MEKTTTSYEGKGANSFFLFKRNLLTLTQFSEQTRKNLLQALKPKTVHDLIP